eukprot:6184702-Pleurochrysis_carterae.AAC.2
MILSQLDLARVFDDARASSSVRFLCRSLSSPSPQETRCALVSLLLHHHDQTCAVDTQPNAPFIRHVRRVRHFVSHLQSIGYFRRVQTARLGWYVNGKVVCERKGAARSFTDRGTVRGRELASEKS